MKRAAVTLLKFAASAALITWIIYRLWEGEKATFERVLSEPKRWDLLTLAFLCCSASVAITFVRWHLLVRALDVPFRWKDAFRLGFLGYFWNFFSLGTVGGDAFKAFFIAKEQPGRRAQAVASVVIDRIIGLYALVLVAAGAILLTGAHRSVVQQVQVIAQATYLATLVGTGFMILLLMPGETSSTLIRAIERLPKAGPLAVKLILAVRMYRKRIRTVLYALVMSLGVHLITALGVYLAALSLPVEAPNLQAHAVIVPLAMITGIIPLPLSGLGTIEFAMDFLYGQEVIAGQTIARPGHGILIALVYRLITVAIAAIGAWFYVLARREVAAMQAAAASEDASSGPAANGDNANAPANSVSAAT